MTLLPAMDLDPGRFHARVYERLSGSVRNSPRRCRSASIDRLVLGRPHSSRQRIGCTCCRDNNRNVTDDVTVEPLTSRPQTASHRTTRMVRPRTARGGPGTGTSINNNRDTEKGLRKSGSKPPISPQARPSSRTGFGGVRHARSTSSVNAAGTSVTASSSRSLLTPEGHGHGAKVKSTESHNDNGDEHGDRLQDGNNGRMSLSELPPISGVGSGRRPGSGRSRRSSTQSQASGRGGTGSSGGGRACTEQTEIVALNGYTGETSKMTKRSTRSPGSTGGSSGHPGSNGTGTSPRNGGTGNGGVGGGAGGTGSSGSLTDGGIKFRAKSWCTPDGSNMAGAAGNSKTDSKLETLFEQKTGQRGMGDDAAARLTAIGNEGSSDLFKRTKSFNNLANKKGSDTHNRHTSKGGKTYQASAMTKSHTSGNLTKVMSGQNIASIGHGAVRNNPAGHVRRHHASSGQTTQGTGSKTQQNKSLRVSKSTPNFVESNTKDSAPSNNKNPNSPPISPPVAATPKDNNSQSQHHHHGKHNNNNDAPESGRTSYSEDVLDDVDPKDEEREQRIIDWLIGVESQRPERPESPSIIDEEPTQTDTAIHIVYDGE